MISSHLDATFAALADPTRRAILARLASGEASVMELAEPFAMTQPAISKHLKVLERAGLISRGQDAQRRPRRLEARPLAEATEWLERYRRNWEGNFQRLDALLEELKPGEKKHEHPTTTKELTMKKTDALTVTEGEVVTTPVFADSPNPDEPQIAQTTAQPIAIIRLTIPREQIRNVMGPARSELMAAIAAQGIASAGPWFSHHLKMDPAIFDFEIGVPVTTPISAAGRVKPGQLPATTVVRTVYHGGYEGLPSAWAEFDSWIKAQGHTTGADLWERYITGPESSPDSAAWRTELSRPLNR